ncbi:hypothetical protein Sango_0277100 [Sesamum angolense]|uniref:Heparan-alpha-glucosaminide N-acetyltransferase catalytic domain-containing protein n=1 Tax=Sesamum angolense TaxID=2727404 RepID=A0AAE1X843_9LAMI|nr:hypothetical protein Sango_0277100 [Sesamum angolense]
MASITVVTDTNGERTPLLHDSQLEYSGGRTDYSSPPSGEEPSTKNSNDPKQRLVSLDVFRGLTVALMILVDDAGKAFPSINHSPWFGVTLADFVMPFFLFGVGVSVSLVFKKAANRLAATKKVILRSIKLFLMGVILQGGYFHGRNNLTYGIDVEKIRVMGVLQRIAIGYLLASATEIWLVKNTVVNSAVAFVRRYSFQIGAGILLGLLYMVLLYGLYVPNWAFDVSSLTMIVPTSLGASTETECSISSPDYGPLPPDSPTWCLAPFDPEGILSSLMAAITCFVGLHYGHVLVHCKDQMQRVIFWFISSLPLLILGYLLSVLGVPYSKPLYTLSYMFITAGASGVLLTAIYFIVDVKCIRKPTVIFQWMGMNALIVYALAACDIFPAAVQGFYWRSPENNLGEVALKRSIYIVVKAYGGLESLKDFQNLLLVNIQVIRLHRQLEDEMLLGSTSSSPQDKKLYDYPWNRNSKLELQVKCPGLHTKLIGQCLRDGNFELFSHASVGKNTAEGEVLDRRKEKP